MSRRTRCGLLTVWLLTTGVLSTVPRPADAESESFTDLLARAKAQASAGHRWTPTGDNMTETILTMMDLIPTATPEQLAELSALLDIDKIITRQPPPNLDPAPAPAPAPQTTASIPPVNQPRETVVPPLAVLEMPGPAGARDSVSTPADRIPDSRAAVLFARGLDARSEERRVGKEC